jgi:hypothetical protein
VTASDSWEVPLASVAPAPRPVRAAVKARARATPKKP